MSRLHLQLAPGGSVLLSVKAVPGASRDQIAGILGDRLKVRVCAPPEAGKANAAVCKLIAKALGLKAADVQVHSGHSNPAKVVRINGMALDLVRARLEG